MSLPVQSFISVSLVSLPGTSVYRRSFVAQPHFTAIVNAGPVCPAMLITTGT